MQEKWMRDGYNTSGSETLTPEHHVRLTNCDLNFITVCSLITVLSLNGFWKTSVWGCDGTHWSAASIHWKAPGATNPCTITHHAALTIRTMNTMRKLTGWDLHTLEMNPDPEHALDTTFMNLHLFEWQTFNNASKGHWVWQTNSQQKGNPPSLTLLHCTELASRLNPTSCGIIFFHRTCDSVAGFCTWTHHHAWIAKLIDELHHSQPRSGSLFPPIQHRSWKPNAVDTPHIHFGFYGHIHLIWILWATRPPCQLLGQKVALRPATMALHSHRRPTLAILLEQRCKLSSDGGMVDIDLVSVPPGQSN